MSTYTKRTGTLTCDECGAIVTAGWRTLAAHTANHARAHQLAARQARIDAQTRCNTPRFGQIEHVETDRLMGTNEATSDLTPKPPLHPEMTGAQREQ